MRKAMLFNAAVALLVLSAAGPSLAVKKRAQPDPACDPFVQASRRVTSPVGLLIGGFDGNGDAKVDRAELAAATQRMFRLADQNHDGQVSLIELSEWAAVWLGDQSAVPGRFDFDRDQDDRISPAEFAAELDRRFTRFDTDKNGIVDRAELLAGAPSPNCPAGGRTGEGGDRAPGRGQ